MSIERDLQQLHTNINKVTREVSKHGAKAINKLAGNAMKNATKTVAKDIGVPIKTIRTRAKLMVKATSSKPTAYIRVNRTHMPAVRLFENKRNKMWVGRGGVIIGKYAIKRGFIQTLKNGRKHVMQREGKARYGIDVVKIPLATPLTQAFRQALSTYQQDIRKELGANLQAAFKLSRG